MSIRELSKARAKEFKSLVSKKERDRLGLFLAEGEKCVVDTLDAFQVENLICTRHWVDSHASLVERFENNILLSDKRNIEIISSLASLPEVIAVYKKPEDFSKEMLLEKDRLYLLLDEIQDPGNLGTIIRTCDWFGVYDIFASPHTVDVYGPKVVQSTMGSLSRVKVHYTNLVELVKKNQDLPLIGTLLQGIPLNEIPKVKSGMLLMGNEGKGISEDLKKMLNISMTIPPVNEINHPDSLNVAIATGIILSHLKN